LALQELVAAAHADAWQALGGTFAGSGGGSAGFRGLRLMASGLDGPAYNSGDVTAADADLQAARAYYGELGVRFGLRVPAWLPWSHGSLLKHQPLMGLARGDFRPPPSAPIGLSIAVAGAEDLDEVARIDAEAFASEDAAARRWLAALVRAPDAVVTVALARRDARAVATGYAVAASGAAGESVMLGGIAVAAPHRRQGIGTALSSWLLARGFEQGAQLAQLAPDDDRAARVYARLGFTATAGHDIYTGI
jgi:GNAT superfamily N-acetyltransferase